MSRPSTTSEPDWAAIAQRSDFQQLVARRRRFVVSALSFAAIWFGGFLLMTSYAHGFMQQLIVPGLSVAYVLGFSQFVMIWVLTALYLRSAGGTFDELERGVVAGAGYRHATAGVDA
ncbi:DUF485 domain-containing protein [Nocardioides sp.]|uniref:DUF485 domain-containing protein n=1 Tax=Nocardioides sp. TaxID=35761 RepID=UPI00262DC2B4|nr:DUF485 domain-containing protein [Nocardioides sp.]MCW2736259.1 hypothetical protein [Nocardioides sp.]